jgi:NhaP-type Na+/H+ or K+/H+ antiporter
MITSIVLVLLLGIIGNKLFARFRVPGLLGMIIAGVALGPHVLGLLDESILANSADIRLLALVIILLRAGLELNKETLRRVGAVAIRMSAIPCLMEGGTVTIVAHYLLGLPLIQAGMLGFILAAVSPAVVVPSMLALKAEGRGMDKGIPIIILAGASVDDVFAITLFTAFLGLGTQAGGSVLLQVGQIPLQVAGGIVLGVVAGFGMYRLYDSSWVDLARMEQLALLIAAALTVVAIGQRTHIAGLLAVMTLGFILLEKNNGLAAAMERDLSKVWFFAQIFLFVLIGAEVNIQVAWQAGLAGVAVILAGLIGRGAGVMLALTGSELNMGERLFCAIAYSPKATVQAAVGGIPLAMGVAGGAVILAVAVLAIIITAPLGAIGIRMAAPRLLQQHSPDTVQTELASETASL